MLYRALRPAFQEHDRAELNRLRTMLAKQVNVHRQADSEQPAQKPRRQEAHCLRPPLTDEQIIAQRRIERLAGIDQEIVDAGSLRLALQRLDVSVDLLAV